MSKEESQIGKRNFRYAPREWLIKPQSELDYEAYTRNRVDSHTPQQKAERFTRVHRTIKYVREMLGNSSLGVLLYGSSLYKTEDDYIRDLDLYMLSNRHELDSHLPLLKKVFSIDLEEADGAIRDLKEKRVHVAGISAKYDDLDINIKFGTVDSIKATLSPLRTVERVNRKRLGPDGITYVRPCKVISLAGEVMYAPPGIEIFREQENQYAYLSVPGIVYSPVTNTPTIPYIADSLLTSSVLFDNTRQDLQNLIIGQTWRTLTRAILFHNDLYDPEGIPKPEAYDELYITRLFIRNQRFEKNVKRKLVNLYRKNIEEIQNRQRVSIARRFWRAL